MVELFIVEKSGVANSLLKSLGLKLGVEKFGVEIDVLQTFYSPCGATLITRVCSRVDNSLPRYVILRPAFRHKY